MKSKDSVGFVTLRFGATALAQQRLIAIGELAKIYNKLVGRIILLTSA